MADRSQTDRMTLSILSVLSPHYPPGYWIPLVQFGKELSDFLCEAIDNAALEEALEPLLAQRLIHRSVTDNPTVFLYGLTASGYGFLRNETNDIPKMEYTNMSDILPDSLLPEPLAQTATGVRLLPPSGACDYHPDVYIRSLAMQSASCFSRYDARDTICQSCPINNPCQLSQFSVFLPPVLQGLREADATPGGRGVVHTDDSIDDILAELEASKAKPDAPPNSSVVRTRMQFDTVCFKCSGPILEGEYGIHVPNDGMMHDGACPVHTP